MNRVEHLMTILAEECSEVAVRASKLKRFGADDVEPGQDLTATQRLRGEMIDLCAAYDLCVREIDALDCEDLTGEIAFEAKKKKIEEHLLYSKKKGTLTN